MSEVTTIIITDLTRFANPDIVCLAGIDKNTNKCIRPMPYLKSTICNNLKIMPGSILSGIFTPPAVLTGPHQEDCHYEYLQFNGSCSSDEFRAVLKNTCVPSISEGFNFHFEAQQKSVPLTHSLLRSIITVKINPSNFKIIPNKFKEGEIKIHLTDNDGHRFDFLPITDLGFHRYALNHHQSQDLATLNESLGLQEEIYLRVGLSRNWVEKPGYWLQVNGIYTFPSFFREVRAC